MTESNHRIATIAVDVPSPDEPTYWHRRLGSVLWPPYNPKAIVAEGRLLFELEPSASEMARDDGLKIARTAEDHLGHACQLAPLVRTSLLIAHAINCGRRRFANLEGSSRQQIRHLITVWPDGLDFQALSPRYPASELLDGADCKIDRGEARIDLTILIDD